MFQYLLSALVLVVLDGIYITLVKKYFNMQIKKIQGTEIQMHMVASLITYILLIVGLNYFIIKNKKSVQEAALLGFIIYGVYEFTNLALFKNWLILTAIIDTTWGTILFALTTLIVYKIKKLLHF